jgi:hypothetical protein
MPYMVFAAYKWASYTTFFKSPNSRYCLCLLKNKLQVSYRFSILYSAFFILSTSASSFS